MSETLLAERRQGCGDAEQHTFDVNCRSSPPNPRRAGRRQGKLA
jgi:hypothetical protein